MSDNSKPIISIITPVYNGQKFLRECIESVINQDYQNIEHIVVDDGSTDQTINILNEYKNTVKVIRQEKRGANKARNLGLFNSSGEYIKFLDHDDYLSPKSISNQVCYLDRLNSTEIGYGYNIRVRIDGSKDKTKTILKNYECGHLISLLFDNIMTSNPLYPAEGLKRIGGFNPKLNSKQEWALNLCLANIGYKFIYQDELIYFQRDHAEPTRISNVARTLSEDYQNFEYIFESIKKSNCEILPHAWAFVLCSVARYYSYNANREGASTFMKRAKEISPLGYKNFWSPRYKCIQFVFGTYLTERFLGRFFRQI